MTLFSQLDDDHQLSRKINHKRDNAFGRGILFELTREDILALLVESGLKSSDWGFSLGKYYVLARFGDVGPYNLTNCRFISQKQNVHERDEHYRYSKGTRLKISKSNAISQKGERNSQYGTYWITNYNSEKKWSNDLGPIPQNYVRGRITSKFCNL